MTVFTNSMDQLIDRIEEWAASHDQKMRLAIAATEKEKRLRVSCSTCPKPACCHNKVHVHLADTLPIIRRLVSEGRDTPELRDRLRAVGDRMERSTTNGWLDSYTPCVFLEDGACSIYKQRPVQCRTYFVVSDPELCCPPSGRNVKYVDMRAVTQAWYGMARQVHAKIFFKETVSGTHPLEGPKRILMAVLPRAVLIMLEAMDSDDYRRFIRSQEWPSDTKLNNGWLEGKNFVGASKE